MKKNSRELQALFRRNIRILATNRIVRNISIYALGTLMPQVMNVILLPVFTRYLSRADYGIISYTNALVGLLFLIGTLTMETYILRHYNNCQTEKDRREIFGTIFLFLLTYNAILLGVGFYVLQYLFSQFQLAVPFDPYMKIAFLINAVDILVVIPLTYFRVRQEAGKFVLLTVSRIVLGVTLSLYFIIEMDMGLVGRYYGLLWVDVVFFLGYVILIYKVSHFAWNANILKSALFLCLPLCPAAFFMNLSLVSDRFILERYVSLSQMGIYAVGVTIGSGIGVLVNSLYRAIEPEVYRMANEENFDERFLKLKKSLFIVLLIPCCMMIMFSKEIVMLLVAPKFFESYRVLSLVAISHVIQGLILFPTWYLLVIEKTRYTLYGAVVGGVVSISGNLVFVPIIGLYGALISMILSSLALLGAYKVITTRLTGIHWGYGKDLLLIAGAVLVSFGILQIEMPNILATVFLKIGLILILIIIFLRRNFKFLGGINHRRE